MTRWTGWTTRSASWRSRGAPVAVAAAALAVAVACVSTLPPAGPPPAPVGGGAPPPARPPQDTLPPPEPIERAPAPREPMLDTRRLVVRIALATQAPRATISAADGDWRLFDDGGASTLVRAGAGEAWSVERRGDRLLAIGPDGSATPTRNAPFVARPVGAGTRLVIDGRRYRGEVWLVPNGDGIAVVDRLYLEDYLRGVVPLEIGRRTAAEREAVAAQAVAARSYAYTHLVGPARPWDMLATVMDQVYGGADAEDSLADEAVRETAGLLLTFGGRAVNAPYHSTCGGSTAAASEVWHSDDEPYLVPVSDRIPGTDRYYCDRSPRFRWTRTLAASTLAADLDRYLRTYAAAPAGRIGRANDVVVDGRTPSGRVRAIVITTDRGRYTLRGNDIRFVLRAADGEILNSTAFSLGAERGADGALARLVVRGTGYGHGIGMCQWGAIGRARAGQDFRTILRTYYPGTVIARAEE